MPWDSLRGGGGGAVEVAEVPCYFVLGGGGIGFGIEGYGARERKVGDVALCAEGVSLGGLWGGWEVATQGQMASQ